MAADRTATYAQYLRGLDDVALDEQLARAGEAYEYFGGHWALRLVEEEIARRNESRYR